MMSLTPQRRQPGDVVWFKDVFLNNPYEGIAIVIEHESKSTYWILFCGDIHFATECELLDHVPLMEESQL